MIYYKSESYRSKLVQAIINSFKDDTQLRMYKEDEFKRELHNRLSNNLAFETTVSDIRYEPGTMEMGTTYLVGTVTFKDENDLIKGINFIIFIGLDL